MCINRSTIRRDVAEEKIVEGLLAELTTPEYRQAFIAGFKAAVREMEGDEGPRRRLLEVKRQLNHVVTGIANVGYSPALGDALRRLEAEKAELERCVVQSAPGVSLSDTEIGALLEDEIRRVGTLQGDDVEEAREALRNMLGGPIVVHPGNEKTPAIAEVYFNGSGGRI